MRCLSCGRDGLPMSVEICPNAKCGSYIPALMRDLLPHGTHLTTYHIDYPLGRGGFGVTYRAHHTLLDEPRAIKEFYPRDFVMRDPTTGHVTVPHCEVEDYRRGLERFVCEGRLLARLHHPGVVDVHDLFEVNGTAYLVMELIPGDTLEVELERAGGKLPPARARAILEKLVDALAAVHACGVYHLDIKPGNVLLAPDDRVVLIDFGAARQRLDSSTGHRKRRTTQALTEAYAPPELYGEVLDVGPESDIYELGVVAYEMLTGTLPPSSLARFSKADWVPTDLGEPWRSLVTAALDMKKDQRPSCVREWWNAMCAPPPPPPPPPPDGLAAQIQGLLAGDADAAPAPEPAPSAEDTLADALRRALTGHA